MRVTEMASRMKLLTAGALVATAACFLRGPAPDAAADSTTRPANYTEKIKDPESGEEISFEMVGIPGGTFLMGSSPSEPGRGEDEGPQHPVTIRPFWLGKCEVSWDEFDVYQTEDG